MGKQTQKQRWFNLPAKVDSVRYAEMVWRAIDTPVSLGCALRAKYSAWDSLAEMSVNPDDYTDPANFYLDYQAVSLVKKLPSLKTTHDRQANARRKFYEAEVTCAETNQRFQDRRAGIYHFPACVNAVLHSASRKIDRWLGDVPDYADIDFRFGPGAAFGVRGETSVYNKVTSHLECTDAMLPILEGFLAEFPGWIPEGDTHVHIVEGSELTFVPKDAKTHRPICIEPLLNGFYQKGFGSHMRERLGYAGFDLRRQNVNQKLAKLGVELGLATVDFSSASDTIAYELVLDLLPEPWFEALDVARCPFFLDKEDGLWRSFEKFSSMGNAYTFELETLIFGSLAAACCEQVGIKPRLGENLNVYGDDVIIPTAALDLFLEVTSHVGFSINTDKSFSTGLFRESCGTDWFDGFNVRPRLLKREITGLEDAYFAANITLAIRDRWEALPGSHRSPGHCVSSALDSVHSWVVRRIPQGHRILIPRGCGEDGGLQAGFDVATPRRARNGHEGYRYRSYRRRPIEVIPDAWPIAFALYQVGFHTHSDDHGREVVLPDPLAEVRRVVRHGVRLDLPSALADVPGNELITRSGLSKRQPTSIQDAWTEGYTVRSRTRLAKVSQVWSDHWSGPRWPDSSIRLCKRRA